MAMRVESLGISGSGKTTLMRACHSTLEDQDIRTLTPTDLDRLDKKNKQGYPVIWRKERLRQAFHVADFLAAHPKTHDFFAEYYKGLPRNLALIAAVGADLMKFGRSHNKIDVFWVDEGFFHFGVHVSILQNSVDTKTALSDLLDVAPLPDAVLYTHTTPDVAIEGLRERMARLDIAEDEAEARIEATFGGLDGLAHRAECIEFVLSGLNARGVPVAKVRAHQDINDMAKHALLGLKLAQ